MSAGGGFTYSALRHGGAPVKFVLALFDDGRGILSTEDALSPGAAQHIRWMYEQWAHTDEGEKLIVFAQTRVERVKTIELVVNADHQFEAVK